MIDYIYPLTD